MRADARDEHEVRTSDACECFALLLLMLREDGSA